MSGGFNSHAAEAAAVAAKSVPSLTIVGATVFGMTLQQATAALGCAFILMQMIHFVWKWRREVRAK